MFLHTVYVDQDNLYELPMPNQNLCSIYYEALISVPSI